MVADQGWGALEYKGLQFLYIAVKKMYVVKKPTRFMPTYRQQEVMQYASHISAAAVSLEATVIDSVIWWQNGWD